VRTSLAGSSPTERTPTPGKRRRMLNVPLLVGTLIALVVLGPAAYCWHLYQMSRTEETILQEADRLVQEGDSAKATGYLHRYLQLHPDDADVRVRLAETFDTATQNLQEKLRAIDLYYQALGTAPPEKQRDLRCRLAELLLEFGPYRLVYFANAEEEARKLLDADPKDSQGRRLYALALNGQLRSAVAVGRQESGIEVVKALEEALVVEQNAGDVELSNALARIYREREQLSDEDFSSPAKILSPNPPPPARLPASGARRERSGLGVKPQGDQESPSLLAAIYRARSEPLGDGLSGIAARIGRTGKRPLGDELTGLSAKLTGDHPQGALVPAGTLSKLLGALYGGRPQLSADEQRIVVRVVRELLADDVMDQMVVASPENPEVRLARCRYRMQYGLPGAKDDLEAALKYGRDDVDILLAAAEQARREAADAQRRGTSADEVGKHLDQARAHYEHAIGVAPRDQRAYSGLGQIHLARGETDRAVETWRQGLEKGNSESILLNSHLAEVLIGVGRPDEAWKPNPDAKKPGEWTKPLHRLRLAVEKKVAMTSSQAERASLESSLDLIEAKWFLRKGHYVQDEKPANGYAEAISRLRKVVAGEHLSASEVAQALQAWMLLGNAYAALVQWDQAATAYEEAAKLQSRVAQPRVAAAKAWVKAGRLDLAVQQYKLALAAADDAEVQFGLAETEFVRQARLSDKERNWDLFKAAIEELKKPEKKGRLNEAWRVPLLEAAYVTAGVPRESPSAEGVANRDEAIRRARSLLDNAQKDYVDSPELFAALVGRYERLGSKADADHALDEFARLSKGSAAAWLLRSQLLSDRSQYDEARRILQEGIEKVPAESRAVLEAAVPNISLAAGELERAQKELLSLQAKYPVNVGLMSRLADLALQMKRLEDLRRWEKELEKAEGENGLYRRYFRAARLLEEARETAASARREGDPEGARKVAAELGPLVQEASKLCTAVRDERPDWARAHALSGWAFELQGRFEQAVSAYQKAIDLGGANPWVYERLIPLLDRLNRFDEADRYLARLKDRGRLSQNLLPYEISSAEREGGLPQAIKAARLGVEARPRDAAARIWYGQALFADGQKDLAEAEFKQAVELAPADARTHLALFNFYVRTQQRERAEQSLQTLTQEAQLSKLGLAYQLGIAYERLGDLRKAAAQYQEAEKLTTDTASRIAIKYRLASLFGRSDLAETEEVLREILAMAPKADAASQKLVNAARQSLADLLAQRALASPGAEGEDEWRQVQQLLQQAGSAGKASIADQRLQALLWVQRRGEDDLKKAQQLLESMVESARGDADVDRFLLARVYAAQSEPYRADAAIYENLPAEKKAAQDTSGLKGAHHEYTALFQKSRQQFLTLVARDEPNPSYLEAYIDLLLRHAKAFPQQFKDEATRWRRRLETIVTQAEPNVTLLARYFNLLRRHNLDDEADQWLTKLEKLCPDNLDVLSLRVLWLHGRDRRPEIEPLVERVAGTVLKTAEKNGQPKPQDEARICLKIGNIYSSVQQDQAAERWCRRLAALIPEGYEPLAMSLERQGRVADAIRVCLDAAKSDRSPRPALVLVRVLTSGQAAKADFELAEPLLSEAAEKHKDAAAVLWAVGNVRIVQDRHDDAVTLYRQALALDPKNPMALNNLATLLSESEEPDKRAEALKLVEGAIQIAGPAPQYLDTKGTALLYDGKPHEAIPILEKAASSLRPDPRFPFHLAVAYYRAGQTGKAKEALAKTVDGALEKQILTKKDQELWAELKQKLLQ